MMLHAAGCVAVDKYMFKAYLEGGQSLLLCMASPSLEHFHFSASLLQLSLQSCHGMLVVCILPVLRLSAVLQVCL